MPPPVSGLTTSNWQIKTTSTKTTVKVTIDDAQGNPIDKFTKIHTKPMHLIAIDAEKLDLAAHVHPSLKLGVFSATLPSLSGAHALFDEYDPAGALPEQIDRYALGTPATSNPGWNLQTRSKVVNGLRFELVQDQLMPGMPMTLAVKITDATTAKPAKLKTWLSAKGHMLATQEKAPKLYHFHPMSASGGHGTHGGHGSTSAPAPGELQFTAEVNETGKFRVFVQVVKTGEKDPTTASFDVLSQ